MSSRLTRRRRRRPSVVLPLLSLGMVIAAGVIFITDLLRFSQREELLSADLTLGGVSVGNLTLELAGADLEEAYSQPVVLMYSDAPILLRPDTVGFRINTTSMLAEATAAGETGGGFWTRFVNYLLGQEQSARRNIPLQADYQVNTLRMTLEDIATRYNQANSQSVFDTTTLTTYGGTSGYQLDVEAAIPMIERALRSATDRTVQLPISEGTSGIADLDTLRSLIIAYLDNRGFIYDGQSTVASIFIQDLTTGEEINILGDVAFTAASTVKVAINVDFMKHLDNEPTQDDAWLMANSLLCSANSTSNLIMSDMIGNGDQFDGIADVRDTMQEIGLTNSYLISPLVDGSPDQQFGSVAQPQTSPNPNFNTGADPYNQTTAEDMGTLFSLLYDCSEFGSGLASIYPDQITQRECSQLVELMSANDLQRLLQGGLPPDVRVSHKNGWYGETAGEAGIVFSPNGRNYVISVYLWQDTPEDFQIYAELWPIIEDISRAAWNHFNPDQALTQPRSDLPSTAQECYTRDAAGNTEYNYLPPYGEVDLNNINGWRDGTPTTPQPGGS
ncbi:serine hydrolase [Phototrophicus methaneseepsis]|uniref:Serine hydrolase n=1 Tax=Phototrophicus methaneseepsis TaxID=2710758 RepID=A0A7S8E613_9CHLR|nr:serine hydrolase [Phototrophicus methaneseepsis]QPC81021.1 serine hydrolase [Phototrophicus methaneseepsis]